MMVYLERNFFDRGACTPTVDEGKVSIIYFRGSVPCIHMAKTKKKVVKKVKKAVKKTTKKASKKKTSKKR